MNLHSTVQQAYFPGTKTTNAFQAAQKHMPTTQQHMPTTQQYMPAPTTTPYTWQQFTGRVPQNAVFASDNYAVIRAFHANDWIAGKLSLKDMKAYVPYDSKEVTVTSNIEILVAAPGSIIEWVPVSYGQVPQGAIGPIGKDNLFVGRAVCPRPESVYTPGKIHPSHNAFYLSFDGKEVPAQSYEACIIRPGNSTGPWERYNGSIPQNAVLASKEYAIIRVKYGSNWVLGKLSTRSRKAYIAYDMKEMEVPHSDFEILVQPQGFDVHWVPYYNGGVPQGAVGPFGADGVYVGRAVCPKPENLPTPGKIHPSHQCMYMPFDGKEINFKQYEALVMVPAKPNWKSKMIQMFTGFNPQ